MCVLVYRKREPRPMFRLLLAGLAASAALMVLTGMGCQSTGVGDPCTPEQEYDKSFLGFSQTEVSVESKSFQCLTRLCLVNHFQGRVSCPYGQAADGSGNSPATHCVTPGLGTAVDGRDSTGALVDPVKKAFVPAECSARTASLAVYCSCRCADVNGKTSDGANYCTCPDGFTCTQLVQKLGAGVAGGNEGLTGAYCVKNGAQYQSSACGPITLCDPKKANCGSAQGVTAH
jgi:hypothetical protein